jgi:2-polyprenyl-3-methyl-5-hydroxy-6-metoxy-1,4-benzoquinol methylase
MSGAMSGEPDQQQPGTATATTTTATLDSARAEAFLGRMVGILNDASLALMCSVGHQVALFDAMASLPPSTSQQIAAAAGLDERYVREWLGAMVAGRIVEYDSAHQAYALPPEHAAALTRAAGPNNLALQAQYIPMMGTVEPQILDSFRNGGGVPYSQYTRFTELMAAESGAVLDVSLLATTLPMVPGLMDRLRGGIDVLDVGCGSGHAINLMAREFPASRFTGLDFSAEGIAAAQAEAAKLGLTNVRFEVQDVAQVNEPAQYDFITAFDCIHDQAQPRRVLRAIATALRPGGVFLMVDIQASSHVQDNIEHPLGPMLYTVSCMHCMTVSLAQGGEGLGTVWGEQQATQLLRDAGFTQVEIKRQPADILNSYYICSKD